MSPNGANVDSAAASTMNARPSGQSNQLAGAREQQGRAPIRSLIGMSALSGGWAMVGCGSAGTGRGAASRVCWR